MKQPTAAPPLSSAGRLPVEDRGLRRPGLVGRHVTVEQAREAARSAARRCLDVAAAEPGSLEAIKGGARIDGYMALKVASLSLGAGVEMGVAVPC